MEGEGSSRVDGNDGMDHEHYADAAYSDALVTDDSRLQRIAAQCPEPRVPVAGFGDWARAIQFA